MLGRGFRLYFCDISVFIIHTVRHGRHKTVCVNLFNLILGALLKAPEHFLLACLEPEFRNTVYKLVIAALLIKVSVDGPVIVQDRDSEVIVGFIICRITALHLLLNDQPFERPVLDLHGVRIIVDVVAVVDLLHVIGQCDQIVETYCSVVLRCLHFLHMVDFVKIESIRISVESDLAILIRYKNELFLAAAEVNIRILTEDLKLNTLKLFVRVVAINLYDLKTCLGAFTFRCRTV